MTRITRTLALAFLVIALSNPAFADKIITEKTLIGVYYGGSEEEVCANLLNKAQSRNDVVGIVKDCTCDKAVMPQCYWILKVRGQ